MISSNKINLKIEDRINRYEHTLYSQKRKKDFEGLGISYKRENERLLDKIAGLKEAQAIIHVEVLYQVHKQV